MSSNESAFESYIRCDHQKVAKPIVCTDTHHHSQEMVAGITIHVSTCICTLCR